MATFEIGGCTRYNCFELIALDVSIDQQEPVGSPGDFTLTGTVASSDPVTSLGLTVNGGVPIPLTLLADGTFITLVTTMTPGLNTLVVTATDIDETDSAQLVVGFQPPAQLRDDIVLDALGDVIERVPWHLRSRRP